MILELPANPPGITTLSTEEWDRLRSHHPDMPMTPRQCVTCKGTGSFRWWGRIAAPPAEIDVAQIYDYKCDCDEQWILHLYLLSAGVNLTYQRLGWHDATGVEPGAMTKVADYLEHADAYVDNGVGLILHGEKGAGKTLLESLLLKGLLAKGHDGYFTTFNEMLDTFTGGWHSNEERTWFHRRIKNAGVLVIDDPGKEMKGRAALPEAMLDEVIRHRVSSSKPTFIAFNDELSVFEQRYGKYVMSLLRERATTYEFKGVDFRDENRRRLHDEISKGLTRPVVVA